MNKHLPLFSLLAVAALLTSYGVAYAQTPGGQPPPHGGTGSPSTRGPGGPAPSLRQGMGSTTWPADGKPGMRNGSTTAMTDSRGFPGIVTEVGTGHFVMSARGKANATTTFTVNVSSATKYLHGSSTAAYGDISIGMKVEVMGRLATSTNTITADRINFVVSPVGDHPQKSQPPGFLNKIKDFLGKFGGKHPGGDASSTNPAAVAAGGDFLGSILDALFGWLH